MKRVTGCEFDCSNVFYDFRLSRNLGDQIIDLNNVKLFRFNSQLATRNSQLATRNSQLATRYKYLSFKIAR